MKEKILIFILLFANGFLFAKKKVIITTDNKSLNYINYKDTSIVYSFSETNNLPIYKMGNIIEKQKLINNNWSLVSDTLHKFLSNVDFVNGYVISKKYPNQPINKSEHVINYLQETSMYAIGSLDLYNGINCFLILTRSKVNPFGDDIVLYMITVSINRIVSIAKISSYSVFDGTEIYSYTKKSKSNFLFREQFEGSDVINGHENVVRIYESNFYIDRKGFIRLVKKRG